MAALITTGFLVGCDSRIPSLWRREIQLRETSRYWIANDGTRYDKRDGAQIGAGAFPRFRIDIESIKS